MIDNLAKVDLLLFVWRVRASLPPPFEVNSNSHPRPVFFVLGQLMDFLQVHHEL